MSNWIDTKVAIPSMHKYRRSNDVLVCTVNKRIHMMFLLFYKNGNTIWCGYRKFRMEEITHWMPLPNPPKENE